MRNEEVEVAAAAMDMEKRLLAGICEEHTPKLRVGLTRCNGDIIQCFSRINAALCFGGRGIE